MLGRFRIVPFENEGRSSRNHLFTDAANQNQSDLIDEADSGQKSPWDGANSDRKRPCE